MVPLPQRGEMFRNAYLTLLGIAGAFLLSLVIQIQRFGMRFLLRSEIGLPPLRAQFLFET